MWAGCSLELHLNQMIDLFYLGADNRSFTAMIANDTLVATKDEIRFDIGTLTLSALTFH